MQKKYIIIIAIVAILVIGGVIYYVVGKTFNGAKRQDEQEAVACTNKTVFRYKYPSEMFPSMIRDYKSNVNVTTGVLDNLIGDTSGGSSVGIDVRNEARSLRDTLNQENIFLENTLRAYFLASNNDPCNDSLRYMYTGFIREMTDRVLELRKFVDDITTSASGQPDIPKDSIMAVIDTASAKVDTTTKIVKSDPNKVILVRDQRKINFALENLKRTRSISSKTLQK